MPLTGRDHISVLDLTEREVVSLFSLADRLSQDKGAAAELCRNKLVATLFYEPSTRTRFSFEAAMQRLGGGVVSCADMNVSSVAKGETIADTVRIVESYVDVIVLRNPQEGSARVAAEYASVPVINAGDGSHEHPTQTLLDLYTIHREKGKIAGTSVALVGDLKHGRTAHSLALGLARFGANVACIAPPGLEMPEHVLTKLDYLFHSRPEQYTSLDQLVTPTNHQVTGKGDQISLTTEAMSLFDVIYVTRVQKERFSSQAEFDAVGHSYQITAEAMAKARKDALIMHPLPRVDELDYRIDDDPRAAYFRQAAYGLPVRMALIAALLGVAKGHPPKMVDSGVGTEKPKLLDLRNYGNPHCGNARCVTNHETYLRPAFQLVPWRKGAIACVYCDHEQPLENET